MRAASATSCWLKPRRKRACRNSSPISPSHLAARLVPVSYGRSVAVTVRSLKSFAYHLLAGRFTGPAWRDDPVEGRHRATSSTHSVGRKAEVVAEDDDGALLPGQG